MTKGSPTKNEGTTKFVVGNIGLDNPIDYFEGRVRAVRVSRGERYGRGFTPDERLTPGGTTVLLYSAESAEGDVVQDRSGNGHHGRVERGFVPPP